MEQKKEGDERDIARIFYARTHTFIYKCEKAKTCNENRVFAENWWALHLPRILSIYFCPRLKLNSELSMYNKGILKAPSDAWAVANINIIWTLP